MLAAGCGLVAYGAVDRRARRHLSRRRQPRSHSLGSASIFQHETLLYWPLLILLLGLGVMFTGLRPREPLPPEPSAYHSGDVPLASRTDEETVLRVRDDSPPRP